MNRARFSFALARILIYGLLIAAEGRPIYLAEFGYAPRFRAALHVGPVIAGELGDMRQEIVFLGDTMNTAARIEQACREHPARCLASAAVLADLDLSLGITADKVGSLLLHGKERPVERFSLSIR